MGGCPTAVMARPVARRTAALTMCQRRTTITRMKQLCIAVLVVGLATGCGRRPEPTRVGMLTDKNMKQLTVVPASINGVEGRFVVDTGAHVSYVDHAFARKIGLMPEAAIVLDTNLRDLCTASISSFRIADVEWGCDRMFVATMGYGDQFNGMIGMDLLARQPFAIDYKNATFTLNPDHLEGDVIPFEYRDDRIYVEVSVDGVEIVLPFDTGSTRNSVNAEQWKRLETNGVAVVSKYDIIGTVDGIRPQLVRVLRAGQIQLGPFETAKIDFMQMDRPALGVRYLEGYLLTIDTASRRMYFKPPSD